MGEYDMEYEIVNATEADREEVLSLYKSQIGREFCPWDEDYPSNETIDWDFERDALFVLKSEGKIKAAGDPAEHWGAIEEILEGRGYVKAGETEDGSRRYHLSNPVNRAARLWEDTITLTPVLGGFQAEGLARDLARVVTSIDHKINRYE